MLSQGLSDFNQSTSRERLQATVQTLGRNQPANSLTMTQGSGISQNMFYHQSGSKPRGPEEKKMRVKKNNNSIQKQAFILNSAGSKQTDDVLVQSEPLVHSVKRNNFLTSSQAPRANKKPRVLEINGGDIGDPKQQNWF